MNHQFLDGSFWRKFAEKVSLKISKLSLFVDIDLLDTFGNLSFQFQQSFHFSWFLFCKGFPRFCNKIIIYKTSKKWNSWYLITGAVSSMKVLYLQIVCGMYLQNVSSNNWISSFHRRFCFFKLFVVCTFKLLE